MADLLLGEVDADLRWDRMAKLWMRWRKPIFYAAIGLIVLTGASSVWQAQVQKRAQRNMEVLTEAREAYGKGDYATAYKNFHALSATAGGNLSDLSRLWEARTLLSQKKTADAATLLAQLAEHPKGDQLIWRDLACLRLAGLSGTLPATCNDSKDSPLKPQRDELRAARLVEEGKLDEAKAVLKSIATNDGASSTVRGRAQSLLAALEGEKAN